MVAYRVRGPTKYEREIMSSLFNLTGQYIELANKLADLDLDAETVADTIEASGIVDNITDKIQAVEYVARGAESHNAAIDAEIARLTALKAHRVKVAQGLRDYIKRSMEALQIERIECPMFAVSIRKNPPAVDLYDLDLLPKEYWSTPEPKPPVASPDKKLIAAALKAGKDVAGAALKHGTRLVVT